MANRTLNSSSDVFVNCPFDSDYEPIFQAIIFAIVYCGFHPRCAKERFSSAEVRVSKIQELIEECQFGVHDISRIELGINGLPRFNMPFEMGLFVGCHRFGGKRHSNKHALVLDSKPYQYQESVSDIAGQDIRNHNNNPEDAIMCIRNWLADYCADELPHAHYLINDYKTYKIVLPDLCSKFKWIETSFTYQEYLKLTTVWLLNQKGAS